MLKNWIRIPILNDEWQTIVCWGTPDEIAPVITRFKHNAEGTETIGLTRRGVCFHTKGCHPVIALPSPPRTTVEIGTLAHEAVHAAVSILDSIDATTNEEVVAHSVGAISKMPMPDS
jgi:hypothetical protein